MCQGGQITQGAPNPFRGEGERLHEGGGRGAAFEMIKINKSKIIIIKRITLKTTTTTTN